MLRNQRGQALLLVLILTTAIFMIGSAAVAMGTTVRKNATLDIFQKKAYYIAEAGIEKALADLRQRLIYPAPNFEEFRIDDKDYAGGMIDEVTVTKETAGSDIFYTISSSAYYPAGGGTRARKTLRVKVKVVPDPFLSYGGPGLKSDSNVNLESPLPLDLGITNIGGSLLARTGDVSINVLFGGNNGGIYAGGNVYLPQGISTGKGEIKAGGDVDLGGILSTWEGEIWAGGKVDRPFLYREGVTIHENCGPNIPGFPLPSFPVVHKGSEWYERVKSKASYFGPPEQFYDRIQWNEHTTGVFWVPLLGNYCFVYFLPLEPPSLELSGINVIDGAFSVQEAYNRLKDRYKKLYSNKGVEVIFFDDIIPDLVKEVIIKILGFDPFHPEFKIIADSGATIVADSIEITGFGGGIDTSAVNGPFGLFAVGDPEEGEGDVVYRAVVGRGGRLSVIATGKFDCATTGNLNRNLNLDWVAAKNNVLINALINLNVAQASVPPGTPVGYQIVSWE